MFFKRKQKPQLTNADHLRARMYSIGEDAATIASMIRLGKPTPSVHFAQPLDGPIRTPDTEELFQSKSPSGDIQLDLYHYTRDFKDMNVMAQVDLMNFFGDIIRANCILSAVSGRVVTFEGGNAIKGLLDQIMVRAAEFEAFFARMEVSTLALSGAIDAKTLKKKTDALNALASKRFAQVREEMFRPDMFEQFLRIKGFQFVICATGPHAPGQKFVNGVHFPAELADAVVSIAAKRQAESLGNRPKAQVS